MYYFHEWIYKELREVNNFGYVASAYTNSYYFNNGIVVLLDGENYEPHKVEQIIDNTI